jgi:hypothetical protein
MQTFSNPHSTYKYDIKNPDCLRLSSSNYQITKSPNLLP